MRSGEPANRQSLRIIHACNRSTHACNASTRACKEPTPPRSRPTQARNHSTPPRTKPTQALHHRPRPCIIATQASVNRTRSSSGGCRGAAAPGIYVVGNVAALTIPIFRAGTGRRRDIQVRRLALAFPCVVHEHELLG